MLKKLMARTFLRLSGWEQIGTAPPHDKYVMVAAPHTSNWDFPYMLAFTILNDVKLSWLGKHTLFKPPMGWLAKALGGIPVDRRSSQNLVEQVAEVFHKTDRLVVAIPPEGSRSRRDYWKSGFYWIAKTAEVPIVLGTLDFGRKQAGFGPTIIPSGDLAKDMETIREYYADKTAKYPERFGPVRLRGELEGVVDETETETETETKAETDKVA